jgi:hypothetical protein
MVDDPIVEEVRRIRRAHAVKFGNDLVAIMADLRRLERESGRTHINFPPRLIQGQSTRAQPISHSSVSEIPTG